MYESDLQEVDHNLQGGDLKAENSKLLANKLDVTFSFWMTLSLYPIPRRPIPRRRPI